MPQLLTKFKKSSGIPATVWALGVVSMFMDISSELIHSILPIFMVTSLGVSIVLVGFLDGLAEATALIIKVFSGVISDYFGKRKLLAVVGYGLSALTKPLFALAHSFGLVFFARMADRVGKGLRGAPRDALITDVTPPELRGAAFGLRQGLDTAGAFIGPLIAFWLLAASHANFNLIFWVAAVPAALALLTIFFGVKEPRAVVALPKRENPISRVNLRNLPSAFWWIAGIGALLAFARVGDAFLVLRISSAHVPIAVVPLALVAMNVIYSLAAYPLGRLADRFDNLKLLMIGIALLVIADLALSLSSNVISGFAALTLGLTVWGLHLAGTQGLIAAIISRLAPPALRGTAFGVFNLFSGLSLLLSGVIAGWAWSAFGFSSVFVASAIVTVIALLLVPALKKSGALVS